jgi:hypothetical protein
MTIVRRAFLQVFAGAAAVSTISGRLGAAQEPRQQVRVATGLLAMWQSTAWLGAEAGIFKKHGVDLSVPAIAVGGPRAAAGVIGGEFEFAHTGVLPVAEEVLKGNDIVILATPTSEFANQFVMTRKEITELGQLTAKKVGVPSEQGRPVSRRASPSKRRAQPQPTCRWSSSIASLPRLQPARSMPGRSLSICVFSAHPATVGMHFPSMNSARPRSSRRGAT